MAGNTMVAKGRIFSCKRLNSLGNSYMSLEIELYFISFTANNISYILPRWWGFFFYDWQRSYYVFLSKTIASICLVIYVPNFAYTWSIHLHIWPHWMPYPCKAYLNTFVLRGCWCQRWANTHGGHAILPRVGSIGTMPHSYKPLGLWIELLPIVKYHFVFFLRVGARLTFVFIRWGWSSQQP